jgi:hypothetical protein
MRVIAYLYQEPTVAPPPPLETWGYDIERVYCDQAVAANVGYRPQLNQLLADNQANPADVLLVNGLDTLGNTLEDVSTYLQQLESVGTVVVAIDPDSDLAMSAGSGRRLVKRICCDWPVWCNNASVVAACAKAMPRIACKPCRRPARHPMATVGGKSATWWIGRRPQW